MFNSCWLGSLGCNALLSYSMMNADPSDLVG